MIKHDEMVRILAKDGDIIKQELTAEYCHIIHMALGVSGETGELVDIIKKSTMYHKPFDLEHIVEEMGDIEFYLEGLRQAFGITREVVLECNIEKLGKRYNNFKYSDGAAKIRADKVC
jgi:NTP pyrophosphatase (non-canonical NTP hydrolase)